MVGADRFDDTAGDGTGAATELRSVGGDAPEPDSYWSDIDYPEPAARAARPAPTVAPARHRRVRAQRIAAAVVAVVIAAGGYALGHANGHAPVPGLRRRIDRLEQTVSSQRSELDATG
jgi:hypothetical protein